MPSPCCNDDLPNWKITDFYTCSLPVVVQSEFHTKFLFLRFCAVFGCLNVQLISLFQAPAKLTEFSTRTFFNQFRPHTVKYARMCDIEFIHIPKFVKHTFILFCSGQIGRKIPNHNSTPFRFYKLNMQRIYYNTSDYFFQIVNILYFK